jgi:hypothetical protein
MAAPWHANQLSRPGKIMLIGVDQKQILEKRFLGTGCRVMAVKDCMTALDFARHEEFDGAVLMCQGSLINVAETVFNLKDLNRSMQIILLIESRSKHPNRLLRQLMEHPIEGTRILTRRELQRELHFTTRPQARGDPG